MAPVFRQPGPGEPTPEEREARIAELRLRRQARLRTLALRSVLVAGVLVLLLVVAGYWLLSTIGGRDFLMAQIVARLPADTTLTWERAEGPASGPLSLYDVRFSMPRQRDAECIPSADVGCESGTLEFFARRVMIDPALGPLLGKRLRLDALQVEGAHLLLPRTEAPFRLPEWPDVLPEIAPPLALQADDIQVDDFTVLNEDAAPGTHVIHVRRLRGGLLAEPGRLVLTAVGADTDLGRFTAQGEYAPGDDYRTDLLATAVFPAAAGRTPARLGLVARGDLSRMEVALAGRAPGELRATLVLGGGPGNPAPAGPGMASRDTPQWQLDAFADALDIGLLGNDPDAPPAPDPLQVRLHASGLAGDARIRGELRQGDFEVRLLPSRVHLAEQVIDVDPLELELLGGTLRVTGSGDFSEPGAGRFRAGLAARGLEWGGSAEAAPLRGSGEFGLSGVIDDWVVTGEARLERGEQQATVRIDGRGDSQRIDLPTLEVEMPGGALQGGGHVAWAPALGWDVQGELRGFDPGYFLPGWDGAIDGLLATTGETRDDGGLELEAALTGIGGKLRGRALDGEARFAMHGAAAPDAGNRFEGEAALSIGDSRIDARGTLADAIDADIDLRPLHLSDLLPGAAGTLSGRVHLAGALPLPGIEADLEGSGLAWDGYGADALRLEGRLPPAGRAGTLQVAASGVQAGVAMNRLELTATGTLRDMQLQGSADSAAMGRLALAGELGQRSPGWRGQLTSLQLDPVRGAGWMLQDPAGFAVGGGNLRLDGACLASSAGGSVCASADWPRNGLQLDGDGLPLALVAPWLPEQSPGRPWVLDGEVGLGVLLRPQGAGWTGHVRVDSANGGLRSSERARSSVFAYRNLRLEAELRPQGIDATVAADLNEQGRLDATVVTGWDAYSPLNGRLDLELYELTWLELLSPDIVAPEGRLSGQVELGGTRDAPTVGGQARLAGFATEIPALAIRVEDGNVQLDALADGNARIAGSLRTTPAGGGEGGGVLRVDGSLGWRGQETPLELSITGQDVLVADTADLHATASPELQVRYRAGEPLRLTGSVTVPKADINLEGLDAGVSASDDVVVLDPVDPEDADGPATPLQMNLLVRVGEDVHLAGFGLAAQLGGQLRIVAQPGREMAASGHLDVSGRYRAYGQDLTVRQGRLSWSGDPIADPVVNLTAERVIGEVTAGVRVTGRVSSLEAEVWANPASSQSEALAYLTLGRPLSTLSGAERGELNAASAALTAGSGLLASRVGEQIGLDDAGLMQSRALGGSVLGVGKYLSPKLYVSYGVSLLGTGQVLTLKYLLSRGFDIEIESSTVENRGSVNWRRER